MNVRLTYRCDCVSLTVADDGCGMQQNSGPAGSGYGMQAMRWRSEAYGGSFSATAAETGGTVVRATLSLLQHR
ncbi:ATP-binding protein [Streptomyces sp. x-80]|uniref:ATP-binding protein n=1 Tax=Streptomyces sp. x-80 TaxID=2789282 RepID=UPI00397EDC16